jgi:hypothetical protein
MRMQLLATGVCQAQHSCGSCAASIVYEMMAKPVEANAAALLMLLQVVAKLVRVKDPAAATALEVAAGGRLYQVGKAKKNC